MRGDEQHLSRELNNSSQLMSLRDDEKKNSAKSKVDSSLTTNSLFKVLWISEIIIFFLVIIFSPSGFVDYRKREDKIFSIQHKLDLLTKKNIAYRSIIKKIKTDTIFQKKLVKRHLDVYAKDEYALFFIQ